MEHIGIDVHKKESQLCILTDACDVIERRIRTERARFAAVLGDRPPARVLLEASQKEFRTGSLVDVTFILGRSSLLSPLHR